MKKRYYILIVSLLLFACTGRTIYKKPDDLIPKEQMIDLWVDIMIANGADNVKNRKAQRKLNYMRFVYKKYQIDSTRFMRSNIYYTSKIEEYEEMLEKVRARLKEIKVLYDPLSEDEDIELPIWKRDSIRTSKKPKRITTESSQKKVIQKQRDTSK